ncbi:hypothetical protein Tco_0424002 [Tanacetum coccineum]
MDSCLVSIKGVRYQDHFDGDRGMIPLKIMRMLNKPSSTSLWKLISDVANDSALCLILRPGYSDPKGIFKVSFFSAIYICGKDDLSKRFTDLELLWQCKRNYSPTHAFKEYEQKNAEVFEEILGDTTQRDIKEILGDTTQIDIKEILGDTTQIDIEEILGDTTQIDIEEILGDTTQIDIEEILGDTTQIDIKEILGDTTQRDIFMYLGNNISG